MPDPNPLDALATVADGLGPLLHEVAFVGAAAAPLMISDLGSEGIRPTDDIDLIVGAYSRREYSRLEEALRERGFRNDTSDGAPLCRYVYSGVPVDVMPISEEVLGFSNRWYRFALDTAVWMDLPHGARGRVVTPVAFVATKLEAFRSPTRAYGGDLLASHDLEDVLTVLDGRPGFDQEVAQAPAEVRSYLQDAFASLLADPDFVGAIVGHLPAGPTQEARARALLAMLSRIVTTPDSPPSPERIV